jgi:hypothetical protein
MFKNAYLTGISAFRIALAVPPEAINSNPKLWSFFANSTKPSLFDTLKIAVKTKTFNYGDLNFLNYVVNF